MIHIIKDTDGIASPHGWDYPLEEVGYLLEEHDGETFVLIDDRLYETVQEG